MYIGSDVKCCQLLELEHMLAPIINWLECYASLAKKQQKVKKYVMQNSDGYCE